MNILDDKNSIRFVSFRCLDSDKVYTIISTRSTLGANEPHYKDSALKSEDILKREDGLRRVFYRSELRVRFTNIEQVLIKQ